MSKWDALPDYDIQIGYVWLHITDKVLISKMGTQKLADVYQHDQIEDCLNKLKPFFSKKDIDSMREHILFNYEHKGITIKREEPGEQMSLF